MPLLLLNLATPAPVEDLNTRIGVGEAMQKERRGEERGDAQERKQGRGWADQRGEVGQRGGDGQGEEETGEEGVAGGVLGDEAVDEVFLLWGGGRVSMDIRSSLK